MTRMRFPSGDQSGREGIVDSWEHQSRRAACKSSLNELASASVKNRFAVRRDLQGIRARIASSAAPPEHRDTIDSLRLARRSKVNALAVRGKFGVVVLRCVVSQWPWRRRPVGAAHPDLWIGITIRHRRECNRRPIARQNGRPSGADSAGYCRSSIALGCVEQDARKQTREMRPNDRITVYPHLTYLRLDESKCQNDLSVGNRVYLPDKGHYRNSTSLRIRLFIVFNAISLVCVALKFCIPRTQNFSHARTSCSFLRHVRRQSLARPHSVSLAKELRYPWSAPPTFRFDEPLKLENPLGDRRLHCVRHIQGAARRLAPAGPL